MSNPVESEWLVKSSGQILGPFSEEQLSAALRERKVSIIDEVKLPHGRWRFIREQALFKTLVDQIRAEDLDQYEETGVVLEATRTITEPAISAIPAVAKRHPPATDVKIVTGAEKKLSSMSKIGYGVSEDKKVKEFVQRKSSSVRNLMAVFLVIIVGIGAFFLFQEGLPTSLPLSFDQLSRRAEMKRGFGFYAQAVELVLQAQEKGSFSLDFKENFVPVLISENQTLLARRWIEELLESSELATNKNRFIFFRALSWMREGNYLNASADLKAVESSGDSLPGWSISVSLNSYLQGEDKAALDFILLDRKPTAAKALLKAMLALKVGIGNPEKSQRLFESVFEELEFWNRSQASFRNEIQMILVALASARNRPDLVEKYMIQFLSEKWISSENFIPELEFNWSEIRASKLIGFCEMATGRKGGLEKALGKAFLARCLSLRGDSSGAMKLMEEVRTQAPRDGLFISAQAELFASSGRVTEARGLLTLPDIADNPSSRLMKAQFCLDEKDFGCVMKATELVLGQNADDLFARELRIRALMVSAKSRPDLDAVQTEVLMALQNQAQYRPYLELKESLDLSHGGGQR